MSSFLTIDQLQVGLFVRLDMSWMDHPFTFNAFRIKSPEQIETLRRLGIEKIRYDPARSHAKPLPRTTKSVKRPKPAAAAEDNPLMQAKRERVERLIQYRNSVTRAEKALFNAVRTVREINSKLSSHPDQILPQAEAFITHLSDEFLTAPEATIHAMGGPSSAEELYQHGLNVSLLSLFMAKTLGMPPEKIRVLCLGALFHDVGLKEIPSRILRKTGPLTDAEYKLRQKHCQYGVEIGKHIGLPKTVLTIIQQHHETMDGSGYPAGLKGEQTDSLARLVQVANRFDVLCNPIDASKAMSPHAALSYMFAHQLSKHDPQYLRVLIRCLGVYPPGTPVHLSNGATALVASVNPERPLKPMLVVYDPAVPKEEAICLDLEYESDVNIAGAINPSELPRAVRDYLCMRKQVTYFFDGGKTGAP